MRQSPGKQAASRLYLHVDALSGADADLSARISAAEALVASRLKTGNSASVYNHTGLDRYPPESVRATRALSR